MSVELLGLNIDTYKFEEAVNVAKHLIDGQAVSQVVTINPEMFEYSNKYGPIKAEYSSREKWNWIDEPWPWQIDFEEVDG